jgi:ABC-type uncharacterized transport system ATPase component
VNDRWLKPTAALRGAGRPSDEEYSFLAAGQDQCIQLLLAILGQNSLFFVGAELVSALLPPESEMQMFRQAQHDISQKATLFVHNEKGSYRTFQTSEY